MNKLFANFILFVLIKKVKESLNINTKACTFNSSYTLYSKISYQTFTEDNKSIPVFLEALSFNFGKRLTEQTQFTMEEIISQGKFLKTEFYEVKKIEGKIEIAMWVLRLEAKYDSYEFEIFTNNYAINGIIVIIGKTLWYNQPSSENRFMPVINFTKHRKIDFHEIETTKFDQLIEDVKKMKEKFIETKLVSWIVVVSIVYLVTVLLVLLLSSRLIR